MTNVFKPLDRVFPCGKDRVGGEVVSITVSISDGPTFRGEISWKRKAWYVNASVNAWHLHRNLCRELRENFSQYFTGRESIATAKKLLALGVASCYLRNEKSDQQYFSLVLNVQDKMVPTLWTRFDTEMDNELDYREITLPTERLMDFITDGLTDDWQVDRIPESALEALILSWTLCNRLSS